MPAKKWSIDKEQAAFDASLDALLNTHGGEWVLFYHGEPEGFYSSSKAAYDAGIEQFGVDDFFLVARVERRAPEPVSISWELGVMFG